MIVKMRDNMRELHTGPVALAPISSTCAACAAASADVPAAAFAVSAVVTTSVATAAAAAAAPVLTVRVREEQRPVVLAAGEIWAEVAAAREGAIPTSPALAVATRFSPVDRPAVTLPPTRTRFAGLV